MNPPDVLRELEWRGFVQQATPGLDAHFARGPVTAYCGFDPTAPSLQLGNLMPLMLLANLQRGGHRPIVLMGGGTGLIGDPSGKSSERPLLSKEQIRENVRRMRDQAAKILEFGAGPTAALLLDNAKWLVEQRVIDFLRDVGKHFTVNIMLQKESVQSRLGTGLSYTEFSYMLLQAYDFLHLFRERQCTMQVGGTEQWGNITAGIDLIRRVENGEAHGLVAPLVTMASGQKFGKTEAGAIYLDPEVTTRVHNADVLQSVQAASAILFGDEQAEVHPQVFDVLAGEIPTIVVEGDGDVMLVDLVARSGLAKSKSEARRSIEQGGIYVNQQRIDDVGRTIATGDWIGGRNLLLRKGKKDYALLRRG